MNFYEARKRLAICAFDTYSNYVSANEKQNVIDVDLFAPKPWTKTNAGPLFPEYW